ncbi:flagellar basal body P-ring formation chaperone FlgA [Pseudomonas sp. ZM23]|uniref:Flagella basal body P-ring formation protein FlgA n=2 Tax=Pseudomonas triclosanedens TaxID=2961893 RepID=A0ABY7A326_9PSED|nr:flagellar basal body P-ring formation chaperone FlgA [Pseudomonas triclosanedens]MCP8464833.1 flagellar basal body P-ring formation chaperone FlgA [Pseudomonas triclosanedens]MCP8470454.1 flagellar basal body P-ring formation chaperone FlgA [Pseudomonas triclosanedens]MCP8476260.1 flagellar basal body P-ring formation chaperone FlgA [Pseudomonas triclosanedens]WAI51508.1 flagellar basal body P-ring formation chaperone FlgA [Pseudomonas triclosanedens]
MRALAGTLLAVIGALTAGPTRAEGFTAPEILIGSTQGFLEFKVEDYLQTSGIDARYEIEVARIDPRLRLAQCDRDLTQALESPAQPVGRVTVRVRCDGSSPWTVFVPATVKLFRQVVVTTLPLKRDHVIEAADISLVERDVGPLTQGYLTDPERVIGLKLRRPATNDQVLAPVFLEQAEAIRKGDQVVIRARTSAINVVMPGEALSDGVPGQQIRVRNLRSQRIVKARVVEPGAVEVSL